MTQSDIYIRTASYNGYPEIHAMLIDEERRGVEGNFLCNSGPIAMWTVEGSTLIAADRYTDEPLGFLAGDLVREGIIQVRSSHRGLGIGTALVAHRRSQHLSQGETLFRVNCTPDESRPFWSRLGFSFRADNLGSWAEFAHPVTHTLPESGEDAQVLIEFFVRDPRGSCSDPPFAAFKPAARRAADGTIRLAERVQIFTPRDPGKGPFISLTVNGSRLYCDKARYPEIQALGLDRQPNGYSIDTIRLGSHAN